MDWQGGLPVHVGRVAWQGENLNLHFRICAGAESSLIYVKISGACMKNVTVFGTKGGTGKSMLACHLAVSFIDRGHP